jgi:hypothetical protein
MTTNLTTDVILESRIAAGAEEMSEDQGAMVMLVWHMVHALVDEVSEVKISGRVRDCCLGAKR